MRRSLFALALVLLIASAASVLQSQSAFPRLTAVSPDAGKAGDTLTVEGENLDAAGVKALYLTDGKTDVKTDILDQSATAIKFKIPGEAKPGRFSLMILTGGADPKLIEQPVKVTVET
ncbi:MAG: IPT/TIG domain-containing protein [Bryobacteraceae bacterium]|nr:IPT/TIG domain-containing protein [Bryobacteraceae bacterium]